MYIDRPTEEETYTPTQDIQLPDKTIDALNHVDPFCEEVHALHITHLISSIRVLYIPCMHSLHLIIYYNISNLRVRTGTVQVCSDSCVYYKHLELVVHVLQAM